MQNKLTKPISLLQCTGGNGYLSTANSDPLIGMGVVDFAGSAVVHMAGGSTALYATLILGPRQGRFYDADGNEKATPGLSKGQSVALQLLGTMILWFGWYGFNPGSALLLGVDNSGAIAAQAAVTTTLAAATGGISALFTNAKLKQRQTGEYSMDVVMAMNGALSGLVAITAGCAVVELWASIVIGVVSGWVYIGGSALLIKAKIDDAVDAIPVHLFNGAWGIIGVGLFANKALLLNAYGSDRYPGFIYAPTESNLGAQVIGIVFVLAWTFFTMFPFFMVLDCMGWFRVNALEELIGLDASYHVGVSPDKLFDDPSDDTDPETRLRAYKQRFAEREELRQKKRGDTTLDDVLNASWGAVGIGSDDGESEDNLSLSDNKKQDAAPEQAPSKSPHLEI